MNYKPPWMRCGKHGDTMYAYEGPTGLQYRCNVDRCTVICNAGDTSRPGDMETRRLRHECHLVFDKLFRNRKEAYIWLRQVMNTSRHGNHIGHFDKHECIKLLDIMRKYKLNSKDD